MRQDAINLTFSSSSSTDDDDDEPEDGITLGSDTSLSEDSVEVLPTPGVPKAASLPAAVSVRTPAKIERPPRVTYCWNPLHLKTKYQDLSMVMHQFVAFLLPSGVAFESAHDFQLGMLVYGDADYYLTLEVQWPDTFEKDDGSQFLNFLYKKSLKKMEKIWMDSPMTIQESLKAKKQFEADHVMLSMAVKKEMIYMRNSKGYTVLRSKTSVKMDFPTEKLTDDCWELVGDHVSGVRMLLVDLEQATNTEDYKQIPFERKVEMME